MLNVSQFIADHITGRQKSMFAADIEANRDKLRAEIEGKRVLVIGGAGTIGSSYIRAVLPFRPSKLVVVDISENGLAELTRDLRSTYGMYVPEEYRTYPLSFAIRSLKRFSGQSRDSILWPIFQPTSMCGPRRINIPFRRCWRIMC